METTSTREETTSSFNYGPPSNPSDRGLTGLAIGLGVGLGGGLLLVVVLLMVYACRRHRDTNYSLVDLPNQSANNQNITAPIAYVNYAFNVASGALGRNIERNPYESVNHKANEYVY